MGSWLAAACLAIAAAGCIYLAAACLLVARLRARERAAPLADLPVTVLKPLHGAEPGLEENLTSFLVQDYGGPVRFVFGVQDPSDPAAAVVARLAERLPDRDIELVVDTRGHGANRKIANLANMARFIRGDIVVLADSDIRVRSDYLVGIVGDLQRPGIGAVTCLYHGLATGGLWSHLAALAIDTHFLPNVVAGVALGLARPCFGSTVALRRTTLAEIGGFAAFADVLADDYAIGAAVRRRGLGIAIPPFTVGHICGERSFDELWRHEIRWARTIRSVDPAGYAGSALAHPLAFALLGGLFGGGTAAFIMAGLAILCRAVLCIGVERAFGLPQHRYWLLPARDLLSFAVFVASFFGSAVTWKGHDYRVNSRGDLIPERRPPIP